MIAAPMSDPRLQDAFGLHQSGNLDDAARLYGEVLGADRKNFDALYLLGYLHLQRGENETAERLIAEALDINSQSLDAHYNRGRALLRLKRHEEAVIAFDRLLALNPVVAEAWEGRGKALLGLQRYQEALTSFDQALGANPAMSEAWNYRGNALSVLGRFEEALNSYDKALKLEPRAEILSNRANVLSELGRFEDAARDYENLLTLDPDCAYALGSLVFSRLRSCDWRGLEQFREAIANGLRADKRVIQPGAMIVLSASADDQLRCARIWASHEAPASPVPLRRNDRYSHDRIRVAYVSADFRSHAVSQLMAGVFEEHDKTRFETFAISFGADDGSPMRKRVEAAFENFVDASGRSDLQTAQLLKEREIDIAVDLMGFTGASRTGVFALRPAPLQVNYLGFAGTMGTDYFDYIVADRTVIPEYEHPCYAENVVYLPDSFQANDCRKAIAEKASGRRDAELPENGFVFCSFNNHHKITPEIFALWMRLLANIDGSVLWLLRDTEAGALNLRREAEARGVSAGRLIFAPRKSVEEHLARHRVADLFLDTLPCNSGTTASDSLWAGLPILTCLGSTFAGRIAASLLQSAGLPELITNSLAEYEATAIRLASEQAMLSGLKSKLASNRASCPLFDTKRFTRHLEAAFATMWQRHQRGESPASFAVKPET